MQIDPLRSRAGLTGINVLGKGQLPGRCLQVGTGKNNKWIFARSFENKFLSKALNGVQIVYGIFVGAEQTDCGYLRIGDGFLEKLPAVSIFKTDGVSEDGRVKRFGESGNVGASGSEFHPDPVSHHENGHDGRVQPGAAVVGQCQGNFLIRTAYGKAVRKYGRHVVKTLQVANDKVRFDAAFSACKTGVPHCGGDHLVPVCCDGFN